MGQRESGSEQIPVAKPHTRRFYFEMVKCVLSSSPPTQQTVQRLPPLPGFLNRKKCLSVRDDDALSVHAGAASSEEPRRENHYYGFHSQSASRLPDSQDGVKCSSE